MIDYENQIFTMIRDAIIVEYPTCKIEGILNLNPPDFPCVYIEEISNTSLDSTITSTNNENHASISYEINVWSAKAAGRKAEAKAILSIADNVLVQYNFSRITRNLVQIDDGTKYRIVARYSAVIDKNGNIYRR